METYSKFRAQLHQLHHYTHNPTLNLRPQGSRHSYLVRNRRHNLIHSQVIPPGSICFERLAQQLDRSTSLIFVLVERTLATTPLGPAPRAGRQNDVVRVNVDVAHLFV